MVESNDRAVQLYSQVKDSTRLFEVSWEAANKIGGIYTVLKTKAAVTTETYGSNYCLLGPLWGSNSELEVEETFDPQFLDCICTSEAIKNMREDGVGILCGRWLVPGSPSVILFDLGSVRSKLDTWRVDLYKEAGISAPEEDSEMNNVILFGYLITWFIGEWLQASRRHEQTAGTKKRLLVHYHEWMGGLAAILSKSRGFNDVASVFTTHATLLGRYLCAGSGVDFYSHVRHFNIDEEAGKRGIYHRYCVERGAAHSAAVFTTVSHITAFEAEHLLGRRPDGVLPNGLLVSQRRKGMTRIQSKSVIRDFIHGHFSGHCDFDLEETLFFFTAGRFEFRNKGVDMLIESLARLNARLKEEGSRKTVVCFIIMPANTSSYNVEALKGQALSRKLKEASEEMGSDIGRRLYEKAIQGNLLSSDELVKDANIVAIKRLILAMRREVVAYPPIVTHNMVDGEKDPVLRELRRVQLINAPSDRVKVVYHPEFLSPQSPLIAMEYEDFVQGCHLGVFPSYYEPWGYTPAECAVVGIPSVTTNLSGFGCYIEENVKNPIENGIFIVDRRLKSVEESVQQLCNYLHSFCKMGTRQRANLRNKTERLGEQLLDWSRVSCEYEKARFLALSRTFPGAFHFDPSLSKVRSKINMSTDELSLS